MKRGWRSPAPFHFWCSLDCLEVLFVQSRINQNKDVKIYAPQTNVLRGKADLGTMGHTRRNAERESPFCTDNASPVAQWTEELLPQTRSPAARTGFQHRNGDRKEPSPCSLLRRENHFKIQIFAGRCFPAFENTWQET